MFVFKLKKKDLHISKFFAVAMLWVFAVALTPWSIFHHHETVNEPVEKHCTHQFHVKTSTETCLMCAAHFEKHYFISNNAYVTYLNVQFVFKTQQAVSSAYAQLISTSLRGPPSFT